MRYVFSTILAGLLWGLISLFIKPLSAMGFSSAQILFFRVLISVILMFVFILIYDKKLLHISAKDLWMFLGSGVLSLTFFSLCYFKTIVEVGASTAVILLYTSPIFVMFFSILLFKEKLNLYKVLAVIFTFAGCCLVSGIFSGGNAAGITPKGFLTGLGAGFGYALYSVFTRYALKKYNTITVIFYTFLFSLVSIIPFSNFSTLLPLVTSKSICLFIGIGLLCTVLPYFFYTYGLSGLETGKAAVLVTVEPVVGTLTGFFVFSEPVSVIIVLGILMILTSLVLVQKES